ncbi:HCLS1-associated protein X-1-like isoform X2 [Acanthaster planci]|nr:HCLS1-associated protein X-1-like isoform X2 [Acanthaster planci]
MNDNATFGPGRGGRFGDDLFFRFEEETQDMFRHFEEMFRNFGLSDFPPSVFSRTDQDPSLPISSPRYQTPRDEMLKHPDSSQPSAPMPRLSDKDRLQRDENKAKDGGPSWHSLWTTKPKWHWHMPTQPPATPPKEDRDLDDEVRGRKLDEILKAASPPSSRNDNPAQPGHTSRPHFRSISVHTVRKPDGTIEQRRTETDADGNITTTVTTTNPDRPELPSLIPDQRRSQMDRWSGPEDDKAILGGEITTSIFEKLFGSWGRH